MPVVLAFALSAVGYLTLSSIRPFGLGVPGGVRIGLEPVTVGTAAVALLSFSALVLPGALLALQGQGLMSALPGASYFGASMAIPFLRGWGVGPIDWFFVFPAAALVLVALPPIALATYVGRRPGRRIDQAAVFALVVCLAVGGIVLFAWGMLEKVLPATLGDRGPLAVVETAVVCFLFGLLAGRSRPGWPWALVLIPAFLVGSEPPRLIPFATDEPPSLMALLALPLAPALLVALAGSVWEPLGERLRGDPRTSALFLLAAVNGLNAADAALTEVGMRFGDAAELNPVVSSIGIVGKLALVGAASYLLYRVRPGTLLWPAAALAAVILYQAAGAVFDL